MCRCTCVMRLRAVSASRFISTWTGRRRRSVAHGMAMSAARLSTTNANSDRDHSGAGRAESGTRSGMRVNVTGGGHGAQPTRDAHPQMYAIARVVVRAGACTRARPHAEPARGARYPADQWPVRSLLDDPRSFAPPSSGQRALRACAGEGTAQQPARGRTPAATGGTMNILGSLMGKILGHSARSSEAKANAARPAAPAAAPASAPAASAAPAAAAAPPVVDVETVLETMAAGTKQELDWRHSIVDLMKLTGIDSSLANRKALAQELGYTGDMNDSATMNIWLHKQVLRKLSENGGQVPANLLD